LNAIGRIRDFALTGAETQSLAARRGVATRATSFDSSRSPTKGRRLRPIAATKPSRDDPGEQEMCRIVRPYGFVVRIDATALQANKASVKLFRFADRRYPAGTFIGFAELMKWLTRQASAPDLAAASRTSIA
jgi:hypothetical protein